MYVCMYICMHAARVVKLTKMSQLVLAHALKPGQQ